jgi:hypothetical protein
MLERGRNIEHVKDYVNAMKEPWDFPHRNRPTQAMKAAFPVLMRDYALASTEQRPTGMARRTAALSAQLSQELSALGIDLSRQRGACARAPPGAARF